MKRVKARGAKAPQEGGFERMTAGEEQPEAVGGSRKRAGDVTEAEAEILRRTFPYAERCVWSDRMLRALGERDPQRKWFSLNDKVWAPKTLRRAWDLVRENRGVDGIDFETIEKFERKRDKRLEELSEGLRTGTYGPEPVRRAMIPKADGKLRPLGIPTVRDRVVQTALKLVIEPIFESAFHPKSFGFRPGRGCKNALRNVAGLLKNGYHHVVDADLKKFFDSIPHAALMSRVAEKIVDGKVLRLLDRCLHQGVLEGMSCWTPEDGTPQGSPISPLLANIYLHPLDVRMDRPGIEMIRYADDFVILCKTRADAEAALAEVAEWTKAAGLELHPEKTRLVDMTTEDAEFQFLGYVFRRHGPRIQRWPRRSSVLKIRNAIREKTPRNSGQSIEDLFRRLGYTLRGWYEYFKHAEVSAMADIDGFARRRLRAILAKRNHIKPSHKGEGNIRWKNSFFRANRLFCLEDAWRAESAVTQR